MMSLTTNDLPKITKLIKKKEQLLEKLDAIGLQLELFEAASVTPAPQPKQARRKSLPSVKPLAEQLPLERKFNAKAKVRMIAAARARWARATGQKLKASKTF